MKDKTLNLLSLALLSRISKELANLKSSDNNKNNNSYEIKIAPLKDSRDLTISDSGRTFTFPYVECSFDTSIVCMLSDEDLVQEIQSNSRNPSRLYCLVGTHVDQKQVMIQVHEGEYVKAPDLVSNVLYLSVFRFTDANDNVVTSIGDCAKLYGMSFRISKSTAIADGIHVDCDRDLPLLLSVLHSDDWKSETLLTIAWSFPFTQEYLSSIDK